MSAASSWDGSLLQIAFAVDPARASLDFVQDLWECRHAGSRLAGRLVMTHVPGYDADAPDGGGAWWQRQGAARVFLTPGEAEFGSALADFLLEHRLLLSRLWVGDGARQPPRDAGRDLSALLVLQDMAVRPAGVVA